MGATALAEAVPQEPPTRVAQLETPTPEKLALAAIEALNNAGQRVLAGMLQAGEWQIAGNEVVVRVADSPTLIDMSLGADSKRLLIATASGLLGQPAKLKVVSSTNIQATQTRGASSSNGSSPNNGSSSNGNGRGRAEQEPVVQKMKELFGAEIRTTIDYKEKR
jgi:hypothetical protein